MPCVNVINVGLPSDEYKIRDLQTARTENRSLGSGPADDLIRRTSFPLRGVRAFDAMQDLEHPRYVGPND